MVIPSNSFRPKLRFVAGLYVTRGKKHAGYGVIQKIKTFWGSMCVYILKTHLLGFSNFGGLNRDQLHLEIIISLLIFSVERFSWGNFWRSFLLHQQQFSFRSRSALDRKILFCSEFSICRHKQRRECVMLHSCTHWVNCCWELTKKMA